MGKRTSRNNLPGLYEPVGFFVGFGEKVMFASFSLT